MKRILAAIGLTILAGTLLTGCSVPGPKSLADDVLQINNDILEDPLLKELEDLEASLMLQDPAPSETAASLTTAQESVSDTEAAKNNTVPAPDPASNIPAPAQLEAPQRPAEPLVVIPQKITFGIVKRTTEAGISLRVVETKTLTAEELRRIKNGEKIQRAFLTDEVLRLPYSSAVTVEKIENGTPVPAALADIVSGQTVRVTLNRSGEIAALRIIRN